MRYKKVADKLEGFSYPEDSWVFRMEEKNLQGLLNVMLKQEFGYTDVLYSEGEFLYAVGEAPLLVVAHTDTVHYKMPVDILYDSSSKMFWSPTGLGADDRAGVWGIIALLRRGARPHVLFTCGEEKGCKGARAAVAKIDPIPDVRFIVELDRANANDMVFYSCANDKFEKYIGSFGFTKAHGSCSDISTLCPEWKIAGVNLSTGYYKQHSNEEHLKLYELATTVGRVHSMMSSLPRRTFIYEKEVYVWAGNVRTRKHYDPKDYDDKGRYITPEYKKYGRWDWWLSPEYRKDHNYGAARNTKGAVTVVTPAKETPKAPDKEEPKEKELPVVTVVPTETKVKPLRYASGRVPSIQIWLSYYEIVEQTDFGSGAFWRQWFIDNEELIESLEELSIDNVVRTLVHLAKEDVAKGYRHDADAHDYMEEDVII